MTGRRKELQRRLDQVRWHVGSASDPVTKERMTGLIADLEQELAAIEAREDGPLLGKSHG